MGVCVRVRACVCVSLSLQMMASTPPRHAIIHQQHVRRSFLVLCSHPAAIRINIVIYIGNTAILPQRQLVIQQQQQQLVIGIGGLDKY